MRHPERMSLEEEEENSKWYDGRGLGGEYCIPFRFREASWLRVTIINADNTAVEIGTTGFTLCGDSTLGTAVLKLSSSFAPPATSTVIISRLAPSTQTLSLAPNAPLPAKDLEKALDHLAMAIRDRDSDHKDTASKALTFPVGEPITHKTRLPLPQQRKGMYVGFSHDTGEMEVRPPSSFFYDGMTVALAAIQAAKDATLAVLDQAVEVGTELLGKIPLFYKKETNGGISFGEVDGDPAGPFAINLQTRRQEPANVASGPASISIGNLRAWGQNATAIGNDGGGPGDYTTSVGSGNTSSVTYGSAFGYSNGLSGTGAVALGHTNAAGSAFTVAMGISNQSSGEGGSAIGYGNRTMSSRASALGAENRAEGSSSSALGYGNRATHHGSSAFGYRNSVLQTLSTAVGSENTVSSELSAALGYLNTASAERTTALGYRNTASAYGANTLGYYNTASGQNSLACGNYNIASGQESVAIGHNNNLSGYQSAASGYYNQVEAHNSGAIGNHNLVSSPHSLAFGYGTVIGTEKVTEMANIGYGSWARVRADGPSCTVALSFGYNRPAPTPATAPSGHEPSGTLSEQMLSFRADEYRLYIDVCVLGNVRTISIPLP